MSLSTDDLREALSDAADAPYDASGTARLHGVRSRLRRQRRRRAAVASTAGALAVAAVVTGALLGGGGTRAVPPASPTASSSAATVVAAAAALPATWGVQDVVGGLTGTGAQTPARLITWPRKATGLVVGCDGTDVSVEVWLRPVTGGRETSATFGCNGTGQDTWQTGELPPSAAQLRVGEQVQVQVRLDGPVDDATAFGAGLLVGDDVIDLSRVRTAPKGYEFVGSYALSEGWLYASGTATPGPNGEQVANGVQIVVEHRRALHLLVRCHSAQTLTADVGDGSASSVTCPATAGATRTLDVPLPTSGAQRLVLRVTDAAPGALVEVGVSAR